MARNLAAMLLIALVTCGCPGCTFQANNASEGVTVDPLQMGSGQVVSPATDRYYTLPLGE